MHRLQCSLAGVGDLIGLVYPDSRADSREILAGRREVCRHIQRLKIPDLIDGDSLSYLFFIVHSRKSIRI
jgi:hypothetical protein